MWCCVVFWIHEIKMGNSDVQGCANPDCCCKVLLTLWEGKQLKFFKNLVIILLDILARKQSAPKL